MVKPQTPFDQLLKLLGENVRTLQVEIGMPSASLRVIWMATLANHGWTAESFGEVLLKRWLRVEDALVIEDPDNI